MCIAVMATVEILKCKPHAHSLSFGEGGGQTGNVLRTIVPHTS